MFICKLHCHDDILTPFRAEWLPAGTVAVIFFSILTVSQRAIKFISQNSILCKKATIHQVITMLATSKNVLNPGHNHLLTIHTDDPSFFGGKGRIIRIGG